MNVRELMEALSELPPDMLVVVSRDAEGNGFTPVHDIETAMYSKGEIGYSELTPELEEQGYCEDDIMADGEPSVVLWP